MSETALKKIMDFITWLREWKDQHEEEYVDADFYAVGLYACYVADTSKGKTKEN